jgi:hypothetical protein
VTEAYGGAPTAGEREEVGPPPVDAWPPGGAVPAVYCPFLASIDLDDRVRQALLAPDTANRCLSTGEPAAPSAHDQRTLCLTPDHPACARFVRAAHGGRETAAASASGGPRRLSAPILAAIAVLIVAAAAAAASLAANGDLSVGVAPSSPSARPAASAAPARPASPEAGAALPVPTPSPRPATSASPVPSATPAPTPTPASSAAVAAVTSEPATPTPRPRRYPGLTACPDAPDCYIYVVKSGDTLGAIVGRYGVTLDEVLERNPSIRDPGLIVRGQEIRLPTPTR